MSQALVATTSASGTSLAVPPVPWRDPHAVSPADLARLHPAARSRPAWPTRSRPICARASAWRTRSTTTSTSRWTRSRTRRAVDPDHFWAQLKYAELHYRLRALSRAEQETRKAVGSPRPAGWQLALARQQMQEIRTLQHACVRNVHWTKPLDHAGAGIFRHGCRDVRRYDVEMRSGSSSSARASWPPACSLRPVRRLRRSPSASSAALSQLEKAPRRCFRTNEEIATGARDGWPRPPMSFRRRRRRPS